MTKRKPFCLVLLTNKCSIIIWCEKKPQIVTFHFLKKIYSLKDLIRNILVYIASILFNTDAQQISFNSVVT